VCGGGSFKKEIEEGGRWREGETKREKAISKRAGEGEEGQ